MIRCNRNPAMTAHIEAQGNLLAIKGSFSALGRFGGGHRGIVTQFTPQSRLRMLRKIARLSPHRVVFVTLTYPERYPGPHTAKQHLRAFLERIRRRYPMSSAIWRLELQERGAPHFHLMFFELGWLPFVELRRWWSEITVDYIDAFLPRVRIELIHSRRGVMFYVAKYCAKVEPSGSVSAFFINDAYLHAGRFWGVFNKFMLPYAERLYLEAEQITWVGFQHARMYLEQLSPSKYPNKFRGKVVFTHGTVNHFRVLYQFLRPDYRSPFVGRFNKWEHSKDANEIHEMLALPPTPHIRINCLRNVFGRGIFRASRPAYDGRDGLC